MRLRPDLTTRTAFAALLGLGGLTLAAPTMVSAQAAPGPLRDFRLPPDPDAPAEEPAPQGPVAPDVPASTQVLRPTPTSTPTSAPGPAPGPTASAVVQPLPTAPRIVPPTGTPPAPAGRPSSRQAEDMAPAPTATPTRQEDAALEPAPLPAAPSATPLPLPDSPAAAQEETEGGGLPWLWILAALAGIAALGAAAWSLRRRRTGGGLAKEVPEIERPTIAPRPTSPASTPEPATPVLAAPADLPPAEPIAAPGLELELEPQRLSLTLMNATLSYRLLLNNRSSEPVEGLTITADMIAAHAALSREQQLSGPDANAMQVASIARLEPGESRVVSGEFRLPFGQIMPIRQGNAALLFPLARFRVGAEGQESLTRTFLVAQPAERPGAGLQPFRLDLGPRVYPNLARRAFA